MAMYYLTDQYTGHTYCNQGYTAWLLTDAMKDVLTQGTGKLARFDSQIARRANPVPQPATATACGQATHHTTHVLYGAAMMTTQNSPASSHPILRIYGGMP